MDYTLVWSEEAIEDIIDIAEYIARDSENYAKAVATRLYSEPEKLVSFPNLGTVAPEFTDTNIRELFIYSYRLIYKIEFERILIAAVIHGSRKLEGSSLTTRF